MRSDARKKLAPVVDPIDDLRLLARDWIEDADVIGEHPDAYLRGFHAARRHDAEAILKHIEADDA